VPLNTHATAAARAEGLGLAVNFARYDVRELGATSLGHFDLVLSCMALDNLVEDGAVEAAIRSMAGRLAAGGNCYFRLRDFEQLMSRWLRYEVREERETETQVRVILEQLASRSVLPLHTPACRAQSCDGHPLT